MLFLHKNANVGNNHLFSHNGDTRPKGSVQDYDCILPNSPIAATVRAKVWELAPKLGIFRGIRDLVNMLDQWMICTQYDQQQADIYRMMSAAGMQERARHNIAAEWRYYNNYVDLILALQGEVDSRDNLTVELGLATQVTQSPFVRDKLLSLALKITPFAALHITQPADRDKVFTRGAYRTLRTIVDDWGGWLNYINQVNHPVAFNELVPCIYDLTMALKKLWGLTEHPMAGGRITKDNMRMNVSTPLEDFYWAHRARFHAIPIWAAPSFTTQFMLRVVSRETSVTDHERLALAYGIFAYWSVVYPTTATPIHRLYGVMTAAREYGINDAACEPSTMYNQLITYLAQGDQYAVGPGFQARLRRLSGPPL